MCYINSLEDEFKVSEDKEESQRPEWQKKHLCNSWHGGYLWEAEKTLIPINQEPNIMKTIWKLLDVNGDLKFHLDSAQGGSCIYVVEFKGDYHSQGCYVNMQLS